MRLSECYQCGKYEQSHNNLEDFISRPNKRTDVHYCGCGVFHPGIEHHLMNAISND